MDIAMILLPRLLLMVVISFSNTIVSFQPDRFFARPVFCSGC